MTPEPKTAQERAEEYVADAWGTSRYSGTRTAEISKEDFLAGRLDFIENDLRVLLEMARDDTYSGGWQHTIDDLIELAKKQTSSAESK